jgi:murein DD-endopeptidase MepM/ murein hydrolase activator NlpD
VTSGFGYRNSPYPCYCHSGVDIASGSGVVDSVKAAYDGVVKIVYTHCKESPNCFLEPDNENCKCNRGFGNMITIEHTSPSGKRFYTHYYHLSNVLVEKGDNVKAGREIAKTGNTGRSEALHLHFEMANDDDLDDDSSLNSCMYFQNAPAGCQQIETEGCTGNAGANRFTIDIPLPGAAQKLKGQVVMNK